MKTIDLKHIHNEIILIYLIVKIIIFIISIYISSTDLTVILNEMTEFRVNKLKKLKNRKLI